MASQQDLIIKIRGDIADIQSKLVQIQGKTKDASKGFDKLKQSIVKVGKVGAVALGAVTAATGALIKVGSDYSNELQQTAFLMGRLDGTTQDLIKSKSQESKSIGMTSKQYEDSAASLGTFMKSMGLSTTAANDLIPKMVQLAADGAAFADVPVDEAMDAISSAAMGNYEALGKLNIEMSDGLINNSSYAKSLGKTTQNMTTAEKTQAIYNAMLERGQHLTGFAASEAGNFSTQLNLTKTKVQEAAGALGEKLLPYLTPVIEKIGDMADNVKLAVEEFDRIYDSTGSFSDALEGALDALGLDKLSDFVGKLKEFHEWLGKIPEKLKEWEQPLTFAAIWVGGLALAIVAYALAQSWGLLVTGLGVGLLNLWSGVCAIASGVTGIFAGVMAFLTSPITLVILAITAVIAIGYLLVKNWDEISAWLKNLWDWIKQKAVEIWEGLKNWFAETWNNMKETAANVWNKVKDFFSNLWDSIKTKASNAWDNIKTAISNTWDNTITWVKEKAGDLLDFFRNLPSKMFDIGVNIFKGLWNGLKNMWSSVIGWISDCANTITNKFKSILGIHSPSREFAKIGMYVDEGLIKGLSDGEVDINSKVTGMAEGLKTDFNSSFKNGSTGVNAVGNNTTINLNGNYSFNNKENMDYFLNQLALVTKRR